MCGRLSSPFLPSFLSPLFFFLVSFFYLCHSPLHFPDCLFTLHKLWPDNSISVLNAIKPQFRGSVYHPTPYSYFAHSYITHQHIMHCPQLSLLLSS